MFKDLYNLSKKSDFHTELKTKLEEIENSLSRQSLQHSPLPDAVSTEIPTTTKY